MSREHPDELIRRLSSARSHGGYFREDLVAAPPAAVNAQAAECLLESVFAEIELESALTEDRFEDAIELKQQIDSAQASYNHLLADNIDCPLDVLRRLAVLTTVTKATKRRSAEHVLRQSDEDRRRTFLECLEFVEQYIEDANDWQVSHLCEQLNADQSMPTVSDVLRLADCEMPQDLEEADWRSGARLCRETPHAFLICMANAILETPPTRTEVNSVANALSDLGYPHLSHSIRFGFASNHWGHD